MEIAELQNKIVLDLKDVKPCVKKVCVQINSSTIDELVNHETIEFAKFAEIPGFRRGKAPISMVSSHFATRITEQIKRLILATAFEKLEKLTESNNFDILVNHISQENISVSRGQDCKFEFDIECSPDINMPDYSKINPEVKREDVTQEDVDKFITMLRDRYGDYADVESPAQDNDMLEISLDSDLQIPDPAPEVKRLIKAEKFWVWLREDETIPGIKKALLNAKPNDEIQFDTEFPVNFWLPQLAEKKAHYTVKVLKIRRFQPLSDDKKLCEFLKLKDMNELIEKLKNEIKEQKERQFINQQKQKYVEQICAQTPDFPLPETMLNHFVSDEINYFLNRNISSEADAKNFLENKEQKIGELKKSAADNLKRFLILRKIAKLENINVSQEDFDAQIKNISLAHRMPENEIRKKLTSSIMDQIYMGILEEKVSSLLVEKYLSQNKK